jgi:hypothetical protein
VTITVRTPSAFNSLTSAAESARGGSLRAISPTSCMALAGPRATASTRNPCASSLPAASAAPDCGSARALTTANAPFTTRCTEPAASIAVASDIFTAGSKGTNLTRRGASAAALPAAARMALSTGSWPPSELARGDDGGRSRAPRTR